MGPALRALRERLVADTLEIAAANAPFYKERLGGFGALRLDDLPGLPTTSKADLVERGDDMRTSDEVPAVVALSSGTTIRDLVGPPAVSLRSRSEIEAFAEFREWRLSTLDNTSLIVNLITAVHGAPESPAAPGVFPLPLEKPFHLLLLRDWLTRTFRFAGFSERIECIGGALNLVRLLAVALEVTAPETLDHLALRQVLTHGDHLSVQWRAEIERILRAPVVDVYGISEVAGATCHECAACGYFHVPPIVVPEVLAPDADDVVVTEGRGELVLTALVPFQIYQPLIRYRTGDVVDVGPPCPAVDDVGFRAVGRVTDRSSEAIRTALLFPTYLVRDVLDVEPDVDRVPYARLHDFGVGPVYGTPIHRRRPADEGGLTLDVQLTYSCGQFPNRAATLRKAIERRLRAVAGRDVSVEVVFFDAANPLPVDPTLAKAG